MAKPLIDSLTAEFDPSKYHDEYREELLSLIERKAQGEVRGRGGLRGAARRPRRPT